MSKIFGIVYGLNKKEIKKYCFNECGEIYVGAMRNEELGTLAPCREETCPYEVCRMRYGINDSGETVWLRKLKKIEEGK